MVEGVIRIDIVLELVINEKRNLIACPCNDSNVYGITI